MVRVAVAIRGDRLRVGRRRKLGLARQVGLARRIRRASRGRSCDTAAGSGARIAARTDGRGSRSRRRRPGTRRATAAAPGRARGTPRAAGSAARAAGRESCPERRGRSRRAARRATRARSSVPRSSASACATDGGPENAAETPRDAGTARSARRRTAPGSDAEHVPQRRAHEPLDRLLLVRIALEHPGQARQRRARATCRSVETRRASARSSATPICQPRDAAVSRSEYAPAARIVAASAAPTSSAGAAVEHGLRRAQREHDVGLEERRVDAYVAQAVAVHGDELRRLGVVHLDRAAEPARELGRHELVDLTPCGAAREPAGDEDRGVLGPDPDALELARARRRSPPAADRPASAARAGRAAR